MRGTFIRTLWWFRYAERVTSPVFWMPLIEIVQLAIAVVTPVVLLMTPAVREHAAALAWSSTLVGAGVCWLTALRILALRRSDESLRFQLVAVLLAPLAGLWRMLVVRPMHLYALMTFWKIDSWGTRAAGVEVGL